MLGEGARAAFEHYGIRHRTVCYVEREASAAGQLVALMEEGALDPAPVWSDLLTFDGAAWRGRVDCVIAGFPCQDLSVAGRRAGLDGKRSGLFFNVVDIAEACGAWLLFLENVSGIVSATAAVVDEEDGELLERAASRVVGELADRGWYAEWIHIRADDVGGSHQRERWFCIAWRYLADTKCSEWRSVSSSGCGGAQRHDGEWKTDSRSGIGSSTLGDAGCECDGAHESQRLSERGNPTDVGSCCSAVGDTDGARSQRRFDIVGERGGEWPAWSTGSPVDQAGRLDLFAPGPVDQRWPGIIADRPDLAPAVEPGVRMLADGMAYLVDESRNHQLRQIGNGVVPLQAAAAFVLLLWRAGLRASRYEQESKS
ncbi:DNA cytosine methyltransferase [Burkholderia ubonensis]|uniref:DNA cytosine methyltransferase n=1 Tax=Burkholderia ubonensis TaxID=101571 RepID=UPI0012F7C7A1|nr:DNA cytosine methyltransferase [Burkholderia ubonensis]